MPEFDESQTYKKLQQRAQRLNFHPNLPTDDEGHVHGIAVPMNEVVIFPRIIVPLMQNVNAPIIPVLRNAHQRQENVILLFTNPQKDYDIIPIGVEAAVSDVFALDDETIGCLLQGRRRLRIHGLEETDRNEILVHATPIADDRFAPLQADQWMDETLDAFNTYAQFDRAIQEIMLEMAASIRHPGWLADFIVSSLSRPYREQIDYLLQTHPVHRLQNLLRWLRQEINIRETKDSIDARVQAEMNRNQREFYLREQLRVIQKELGETDIWTQDANELQKRIEEADLPEHVRAAARKEAERLAQMPPMAPETGVIRTYLDWLLELPWTKRTEDNLDVKHAAAVLEKAHYGLKKPKDRILEYIAVRSLKPPDYRQPILCFVGPPGTGKTSLGKAIAEALGRKFVRISLGGVRDEAEIRGHRRTYIGALPGRIIQTIRRAGVANPLFMLDEIDKLGHDFRGDPASALLEVLDPEQNSAFSDHYLELDFDLSQVMFIATANSLDSIPEALLDRMEVIEFSGYVEEEKLEIARRFLIPRQMRRNGIAGLNIRISDGALKRIIREYTYEAGVRNLERTIGTLCRKIARARAEDAPYPAQITAPMLEKLLGPPEYHGLETEAEDQVGLALGLAWTANGGEIMPVEVAIYEGKGSVQTTGQLGEVMQESVQAALSYIRSRAAAFDIPMDVFERMDIHLHLPETAIPKDGPSAGITLCTAVLSALTGRPVRHQVAMTGEITLRGRVLPVGGLRAKVLAAYRHKIPTVLIPWRNQKDLQDLPPAVKKAVKIQPVRHMDEVLAIALGDEAVIAPPRPRNEEEECKEKE